MRSKVAVVVSALSTLALINVSAHAEPFTYSWEVSPTVLHPKENDGGSVVLSGISSDGATFFKNDGKDSTLIVAAGIHVIVSSGGSVDHYAPQALALTLQLTDSRTGQSGQLGIKGIFSGTVNPNAFGPVLEVDGVGTQVMKFANGALYSVPLLFYFPQAEVPFFKGFDPDGQIYAMVIYAPPANAPEPSTMVLLGLGMCTIGIGQRRRSTTA